MENQLKQLIEEASSVLITSHIGPDGDSLSSSLLLYQILKLNYPDKKIAVAMEEEARDLSFLDQYNEVEFNNLDSVLAAHQPDLLLILDANSINRVTRRPEEVRAFIQSNGLKLGIIDHHEAVNIEPNNLYINNNSPAVTLDIYELFLEKLGLNKPQNYAQTAMTGIYTDTGGFINRNLNFKKTFEVVPKLIEDGANIEFIVSQLSKISEAGLKIIQEFIANTGFKNGYTYSFLSDQTTSNVNDELIEAVRQGADIYRAQFLRSIEGRPWGFIVYRDLLASTRTYSVSFRAISDGIDVSKIAQALGGGGHKPAAAAKIQADNVNDVISKVEQAIELNTNS